MMDQDENARPSFQEIANHPWMRIDSDNWRVKLDGYREEMEQRKMKAKENGGGGEDSVARRGIGGSDKRGDLNTDDIDTEINKDNDTRNMVKVADYDYEMN